MHGCSTLTKIAVSLMFTSICRCGGMADAGDLKSPAPQGRAGSSPATGTTQGLNK